MTSSRKSVLAVVVLSVAAALVWWGLSRGEGHPIVGLTPLEGARAAVVVQRGEKEDVLLRVDPDGVERWSLPLGARVAAEGGGHGLATVGGRLYVQLANQVGARVESRLVDTETGQQLWRVRRSGGKGVVFVGPTLVEDVVVDIAPTGGVHEVVALSVLDGKEAWRTTLSGTPMRVAAVPGGVLVRTSRGWQAAGPSATQLTFQPHGEICVKGQAIWGLAKSKQLQRADSAADSDKLLLVPQDYLWTCGIREGDLVLFGPVNAEESAITRLDPETGEPKWTTRLRGQGNADLGGDMDQHAGRYNPGLEGLAPVLMVLLAEPGTRANRLVSVELGSGRVVARPASRSLLGSSLARTRSGDYVLHSGISGRVETFDGTTGESTGVFVVEDIRLRGSYAADGKLWFIAPGDSSGRQIFSRKMPGSSNPTVGGTDSPI